MHLEISIDRVLYLPAPDLEALVQGQVVAAIPKAAIEKGWSCILCPSDASINSLPIERHYHPNLSKTAQAAAAQLQSTTVEVKAWAICEFCTLLFEIEKPEILSQLIGWTPLALKKTLEQRHHLFLACLRVYQLPEVIKVSTDCLDPEKIGKFGSLASLASPQGLSIPLKVNTSSPILSDFVFNQRKQQLTERELPPHPELEKLHYEVAQLATSDPKAKVFENELKSFLKWAECPAKAKSANLAWIRTINDLGNRSKDLDKEKSNYQAGTDFENVVRDSLKFLGFSIDEAYKGGAGGLDLFCSKPYPLVGECKAGKRIPSGTTQELIKLGGMHLGTNQFLQSTKLIIGPGKPTPDVLTAATEWRVSIINPMSLQKLVELQAKHPGSVDLIELKKYLEPGQIDHRIDEYVDRVLERIKLRAHIIQVVKKHLEQVKAAEANIDTLFGVYCGSNPPHPVEKQDFQEILIELSSPLVGYLGRIRGANLQSDRFYFLRDMSEIA